MKPSHLLPIIFTLLFAHNGISQSCTAIGQTASTAFPVCGTATFKQGSVGICSNGNLPTGCNDNASYADKNPYWYKFTCFGTGTLAFVVTPKTAADDYDWELFDVTNRDPTQVYNNVSWIVCNNWSSLEGATGTSAAGKNIINCAGPTNPNFSAMPTLTIGHNYLLMISHFTDTQDGYSLSFGGGTANITDPTDPSFQSAHAICDGQTMTVKLNKKMKCSSLSADGSDFNVTPNAKVSAAVGIGCSTGFDTDSVILSLASPLPPGNYIIAAQNGVDGNTMLDNCSRTIPVGDSKTVTVYPQTPTPMDSITPIFCAPTVLHLVFKKPMKCSSVAANGTDFTVTGPSIIKVASAAAVCDSSGLGYIIDVQLATPISVAGTYTITLKIGSDGNTIINECGQPTAAGSNLNFVGYDTVSASIMYMQSFSCLADTITFSNDGRNNINQWRWIFDDNTTSSLEFPQAQIYTTDGNKRVRLAVSNGVCSDSTDINILVSNAMALKAGIIAPTFVCPNDTASFKDSSTGQSITNWNWAFGNGETSTVQNPPAQFFQPTNLTQILVAELIVNNNLCADTAYKKYSLVNNCYIDVPTGFTPNGDGLNDNLFPLNAYKADNLIFRVYNRLGQLLFETADWTRKWDGRFNGSLQPTGAYIWMLEYTHHDTGKHISLKGTSVLIR